MRSADYDRSVFVNCPLDDEYRPLLEAVVFAIPGGKAVTSRYAAFRGELPSLCARLPIRVDELTFIDYVAQVEDWVTLNPRIDV
jgi:hypothetical protein